MSARDYERVADDIAETFGHQAMKTGLRAEEIPRQTSDLKGWLVTMMASQPGDQPGHHGKVVPLHRPDKPGFFTSIDRR